MAADYPSIYRGEILRRDEPERAPAYETIQFEAARRKGLRHRAASIGPDKDWPSSCEKCGAELEWRLSVGSRCYSCARRK